MLAAPPVAVNRDPGYVMSQRTSPAPRYPHSTEVNAGTR